MLIRAAKSTAGTLPSVRISLALDSYGAAIHRQSLVTLHVEAEWSQVELLEKKGKSLFSYQQSAGNVARIRHTAVVEAVY